MGGSGRDSARVLSFSTTHSASAVRLQFKSCRRFELASDCDWYAQLLGPESSSNRARSESGAKARSKIHWDARAQSIIVLC